MTYSNAQPYVRICIACEKGRGIYEGYRAQVNDKNVVVLGVGCSGTCSANPAIQVYADRTQRDPVYEHEAGARVPKSLDALLRKAGIGNGRD